MSLYDTKTPRAVYQTFVLPTRRRGGASVEDRSSKPLISNFSDFFGRIVWKFVFVRRISKLFPYTDSPGLWFSPVDAWNTSRRFNADFRVLSHHNLSVQTRRYGIHGELELFGPAHHHGRDLLMSLPFTEENSIQGLSRTVLRTDSHVHCLIRCRPLRIWSLCRMS